MLCTGSRAAAPTKHDGDEPISNNHVKSFLDLLAWWQDGVLGAHVQRYAEDNSDILLEEIVTVTHVDEQAQAVIYLQCLHDAL